MKTLNGTPTTLMFHAEMIPPIADSVGDTVQTSLPPLAPHGDLTSYNTFLESRPPAFETYAVEEIIALAHLAPQLHLHIVHLSATECIPLLRAARKSGINITAETCFHYLGLASDDISDGDTRHKCCPPIRNRLNQDGLWAELTAEDSCIRTVVSDHSPCTPELKLLPNHLQHAHGDGCGRSDSVDRPVPHAEFADSGIDITAPGPEPATSTNMLATKPEDVEAPGDFFAAWGGISSVGLGLPILHAAAAARASKGEKAPSIVDMVRLCSQATARQVGLADRKGGLRAGLDADVCVFDDGMGWELHRGDMWWRNRCSPWEGKGFHGRVTQTWLRGNKVFELGGANGGFVGWVPIGEAIVERRTE